MGKFKLDKPRSFIMLVRKFLLIAPIGSLRWLFELTRVSPKSKVLSINYASEVFERVGVDKYQCVLGRCPYFFGGDLIPYIGLDNSFLALIGAQGVTLYVRVFFLVSVCLAQICLGQSIYIFQDRRAIRAFREQPESNKSIKIRVIRSEPINILCLVILIIQW